jgi:hypothetical protein
MRWMRREHLKELLLGIAIGSNLTASSLLSLADTISIYRTPALGLLVASPYII